MRASLTVQRNVYPQFTKHAEPKLSIHSLVYVRAVVGFAAPKSVRNQFCCESSPHFNKQVDIILGKQWPSSQRTEQRTELITATTEPLPSLQTDRLPEAAGSARSIHPPHKHH